MNEIRDIINFHVVGYGQIGKRHAKAILKTPSARLASVIDIDPGATARAEAKGITAFESIEKWHEATMQSRAKSVNVACICVPNGLHAELAIRMMEAGCHVLVEKPLDIRTSAASMIKDTAINTGKLAFCVLQNRFTSVSKLLKDTLVNGAIGEINQVVVNCFWNRGREYYENAPWRGTKTLDGGPLFTQFSHYIDLLIYLLGPISPKHVALKNVCHDYTQMLDDSGIVVFTNEKQSLLGTFNYSIAVPKQNMESSIILIGTKGTIKAGGQYMEKIEHWDVEGITLPQLAVSLPNDYGSYKGSAANHEQVIQNMILACSGAEHNLPHIDDAIGAVNFIERVYSMADLLKN